MKTLLLLLVLSASSSFAQFSMKSDIVNDNYPVLWSNGAGCAYAAGAQGLVIRTNDAGASWKKADLPNKAPVTTVDFADANRGCFGTENGVIFLTADRGQSYSFVELPGGRKVSSLALKPDGEGVAVCADGGVFHTENYGQAWRREDSLATSANFRVIELRTTFGVAGDDNFLAVRSAAAVWQRKELPPTLSKTLLSAGGDAVRGYALNFYSTIIRLTPDGEVGSVLMPDSYAQSAWPLADDSMLVLGANALYLYDGKGVVLLSKPPQTGYYQSLQTSTLVPLYASGWLISGNNSLLAVAESGKGTWGICSYINTLLHWSMQSMTFVNDSVGFISGRGLYMLRTRNSGLTWKPNDTLVVDTSHWNWKGSIEADYTNLSFANEQYGVSAGLNQNRYKTVTDNGGVTIRNGDLVNYILGFVRAVAPNEFYYMGNAYYRIPNTNTVVERAYLYKTTDDGRTWLYNYNRADSAAILDAQETSNGSLIILLEHKVTRDPITKDWIYPGISMLKSPDGGITITDSIFCSEIGGLQTLFVMVNNNLGFLYGALPPKNDKVKEKTALYRTTDGGTSWHYLAFPNVPNAWITSMAFTPDARLGVCSAHNKTGNYFLASTDQGETWQLIGNKSDWYTLRLQFAGNNTFIGLQNSTDFSKQRLERLMVQSATPVDDPPTPAPRLAPIWLWQPYPNPASAAVNLELQWGAAIAADNTEFALYSMLGETVADLKGLLPHTSRVGDKTTLRWTLPDALPDGMYYLVAGTGGYKRAQALAVIRR